jgi:glutathione S-transferase
MSMKLYYAPGACSLSSHIILREAGAKFELERVDNKAKKTEKGADFWQINPKGYVPVLELDDGRRLTENPVVLQYVADQHPDAGLAPPCGSFERYCVEEWLNFIGTELHKPFGALFKDNTPEEYKTIAKENLARRYAYLEEHLRSRQYLQSGKFGIADSYLFVVTNWMGRFNIDMGNWPNVKAYYQRIAARPKVRDAMQAEGLKVPQAA